MKNSENGKGVNNKMDTEQKMDRINSIAKSYMKGGMSQEEFGEKVSRLISESATEKSKIEYQISSILKHIKYKHIVIVTNNRWGDHSSSVYVLESHDPKSAIASVIQLYPDIKYYDSIDIDSAMENYECEPTTSTNGRVTLKSLSKDGYYYDDGSIDFEAFRIFDNEPTPRKLEW